MLIDVLKNLQIKANVQLVRTCVLSRYLEHDQRKRRLPDRPAWWPLLVLPSCIVGASGQLLLELS